MKEKLFEKYFSHYWWKKRGFGYRCSHNEIDEMEIIGTFIEAMEEFEKQKKGEKNVK